MHVPANIPAPTTGLEYLPGKLPTCEIPPGTDFSEVAAALLKQMPNLESDFFTEDCLWRDQLSMSDTFRTIYGGDRARATWMHLAKTREPSAFALTEKSAFVMELGNNNRFIFAAFTFDTKAPLPARHTGFLNIVPGLNGPDSWRVWGLQTIMEAIKNHEPHNLRKLYPDPQRDIFPDVDEGINVNRHYRDYVNSGQNAQSNGVSSTNGEHAGDKHADDAVEDRFDVIVIGGGQAGLSTAGYCKSLDLKAVIVERNEEIGDNWTNRYGALYLHTPHRFNDLAFGPTFNDEEYSEWLTAAELKKGYQYYAKRYHIDAMTSSVIESCVFSEEEKQWTMKITQKSQQKTLYAKHVVLAIGSGGSRPLMPHYPGQENYKGTVMHSVNWKDGKQFKGKKGIVVGTANTGHDMAESMLAADFSSVTMLQRGTTYVIPRDFMTGFLNYMWPEHSVRSQDMSDRLFWATPTSASRQMCYNLFNPQFDAAPELFDGLEKAGFRCDRRGDFIDHLLVRFGGHYMNHGASEKIIQGDIQMKGDSPIAAYTETGLEFVDGSKLDADVIVFATGFEKDLTLAARDIFGTDVAANLDEFWGIDEEGEHRGAFVPCGYPNMWMTGGGCGHARYFTRLIALQIQRDILGHPVEPYKGTQVSV